MAIKDLSLVHWHIILCEGDSCQKLGASACIDAIRDHIKMRGLDEQIHTTRTRCNGRCGDGPVAIVYPDGTWYQHLTTESIRSVVDEHIILGVPLQAHFLHQLSNHATGNRPTNEVADGGDATSAN